MNTDSNDQSHEKWIWGGQNGVELYPIFDDPPDTKAICVFGPDSIHPHDGFGWWKTEPKRNLNSMVAKREKIVGEAYSQIHNSSMTLDAACDFAKSVHKYPCFYICRSYEELCSAFDFWLDLGGSPYGVSDSDIFLLPDAVVTTYTPEYGDIPEMWGDG